MTTTCETKTETRADGCKYADDLLGEESFCAGCPFTGCVKEEIRKYYRDVRNSRIARLSGGGYFEGGMSSEKLGRIFNLCGRRIRQILRESNGGG